MKKSRSLSLLLCGLIAASSLAGFKPNTATISKASTPVFKGPAVTLTWYLVGTRPQNYSRVISKINSIIKPKINAKLQLKFYDWGEYESKMQMLMSSGAAYDLCFTSSWLNKYQLNVSKNAYAPLDKYLAKYPSLKKIMPQKFWDSAKIKGKLYAVPNLQKEYNQAGLALNKAMVNKYGINVNSIKKMSDLTAIYQKIKDNEKDVICLADTAQFPTSNYSSLDVSPLFVNTKTWKVVSTYDIPASLTAAKLQRTWNLKGFFAPDCATLTDYSPLIKAGKVFSFFSSQKPGNDAELKKNYGIPFVTVSTGPMLFQSQAIFSCMNAISRTSKNPARAFALLALVNTDKTLYNELVYGNKGQDYQQLSKVRVKPATNGWSIGNWMVGNVFNSYLIPGQDTNVWAVTKKNNETAKVDPLSGFATDTTKIETQVAAINSVNTQYNTILRYGLEDATTAMNEYKTKLQACGINDVINEAQRQLSKWVAANKK